MTTKTLGLDPKVYDYLLASSRPEHPVLEGLRAETAKLGPIARMQIGRDQGAFMALLVKMTGARRVLEIGTFTGYSSTAMALALPPEGRLVTCDVSDEYTQVARRAWQSAGVADRVELRLAPALATLDELLAGGGADSFDLAFIDADKGNYEGYWERCVALVRPGGSILVDNVLWSGRVADPSDQSADTQAIRRLNGKIRDDVRVAMAMVSVGDGLTLACVLERSGSGQDQA